MSDIVRQKLDDLAKHLRALIDFPHDLQPSIRTADAIHALVRAILAEDRSAPAPANETTIRGRLVDENGMPLGPFDDEPARLPAVETKTAGNAESPAYRENAAYYRGWNDCTRQTAEALRAAEREQDARDAQWNAAEAECLEAHDLLLEANTELARLRRSPVQTTEKSHE